MSPSTLPASLPWTSASTGSLQASQRTADARVVAEERALDDLSADQPSPAARSSAEMRIASGRTITTPSASEMKFDSPMKSATKRERGRR